MAQVNNINATLDSDLLVLRKDGGFSTLVTINEINTINAILNESLKDNSLSSDRQKSINTIMKILRKNDVAANGYSLDDILLKYSEINRKADSANEQFRSDAFKVYYQYFVNMNKKRKMLLQRSDNDKTLFLYDDKLIYRIHIKSIWNGHFYIETFKVYNANGDTIESRNPVVTFSKNSCASMRYIKNPLFKMCQGYCDEINQYVDDNIDTLVKMKVKKTPPIQDIFDVINTLDDEYLYFKYGQRAVQSTSEELLVTLKLL